MNYSLVLMFCCRPVLRLRQVLPACNARANWLPLIMLIINYNISAVAVMWQHRFSSIVAKTWVRKIFSLL